MNNIFEAIPADLPEELFETLVESSEVRIERIVSRGHTSPQSGWYDQPQNEWVIVLKGQAVLAFEQGEAVTLKAGDFLTIPAHRRHRVEWTAPGIETIWLAVHY
ncbi:MAG: cupin domain-containing protein [Gammaproteobacteria bacterium]|nr:cupin domain-containing protein [Gammaproteobacteria bacterium]